MFTKTLRLFTLGIWMSSVAIVAGDEPAQGDDSWTLWTSKTTTLWGANIFQQVDPDDSTKWWPTYERKDFENLRAAGANYVNFSVPGPFEPVSGNCNPNHWQHLKELVSIAKEAQLKIVISFRTSPGRNEDDLTKKFGPTVIRDLLDDPNSPNIQKFCDMWKMVAKEYASEPAVVGFDLLVVPHEPAKYEDGKYYAHRFRRLNRWYDVASKAVNAIRRGCHFFDFVAYL